MSWDIMQAFYSDYEYFLEYIFERTIPNRFVDLLFFCLHSDDVEDVSSLSLQKAGVELNTEYPATESEDEDRDDEEEEFDDEDDFDQ